MVLLLPNPLDEDGPTIVVESWLQLSLQRYCQIEIIDPFAAPSGVAERCNI